MHSLPQGLFCFVLFAYYIIITIIVSYPLIIDLETHCTFPQQREMARLLRENFGDILFTLEFNTNNNNKNNNNSTDQTDQQVFNNNNIINNKKPKSPSISLLEEPNTSNITINHNHQQSLKSFSSIETNDNSFEKGNVLNNNPKTNNNIDNNNNNRENSCSSSSLSSSSTLSGKWSILSLKKENSISNNYNNKQGHQYHLNNQQKQLEHLWSKKLTPYQLQNRIILAVSCLIIFNNFFSFFHISKI